MKSKGTRRRTVNNAQGGLIGRGGRVALYMRYSTTCGDPEDAAAVAAIGCLTHDVAVYVDQNCSGTTRMRPQLDALLDRLESGAGVAHVVTPSLDRLSRDAAEAARLRRRIERTGATLVLPHAHSGEQSGEGAKRSEGR